MLDIIPDYYKNCANDICTKCKYKEYIKDKSYNCIVNGTNIGYEFENGHSVSMLVGESAYGGCEIFLKLKGYVERQDLEPSELFEYVGEELYRNKVLDFIKQIPEDISLKTFRDEIYKFYNSSHENDAKNIPVIQTETESELGDMWTSQK
jgi:hypothetical protein